LGIRSRAPVDPNQSTRGARVDLRSALIHAQGSPRPRETQEEVRHAVPVDVADERHRIPQGCDGIGPEDLREERLGSCRRREEGRENRELEDATARAASFVHLVRVPYDGTQRKRISQPWVNSKS
jgi:hypothetical protein